MTRTMCATPLLSSATPIHTLRNTSLASLTLIITTTSGRELRAIDSGYAWQQRIRQSQFFIEEGDAWHTADAYPDRCAEAALQFIAAQRYTE